MRESFPLALGPDDMNGSIMEWKNMQRPSKTEFEAMVVAVGVALLHCKGRLPWS